MTPVVLLLVCVAGLVLPGAGGAAELWRADFDFAQSDVGWDVVDGFWDVTDHAYRGRARDAGWTLNGAAGWKNYLFEGRWRSDPENPGEVALLFRVQDVVRGDNRGHYYLITHDLQADRVQLWLVENGRTLLEEKRCKLEPGIWYEFEIEAQGRFVRYRLDGEQQLASEQADEYLAGRIGLGVRQGTAWFDELLVSELPPPREAEPHDRGRPLGKDGPDED
jgi:hypothetical protein